jgi:hypothetical protein
MLPSSQVKQPPKYANKILRLLFDFIYLFLSETGAVGLEIQKQHFGAFAEIFGNYGLGNSMYNATLTHVLTAQNQKVEARIIKAGIRIGIRLW